MADTAEVGQAYWDHHARRDPLWAILSDPSKTGRRWDLAGFLETGRREVSLLMYQLRALNIDVSREAALDFGCGVGRLSQPLANHFDRVVGIDISPEMIRLANDINRHPGRVRYVCNARDDLAVCGTGEFTFMYSNLVLQHIEPEAALRYLRELFRVVRPGGLLVFQLPAHRRSHQEQQRAGSPMIDEAYRASILIESRELDGAAPGAEVVLAASVRNTSPHTWAQRDVGPISVGNHWLAAAGRAMLIQDDGRARLPDVVLPGQTCPVTLTITMPPEPGEYQLECDIVHEGIAWFGDKGSETWRRDVRVTGLSVSEPFEAAAEPVPAGVDLRLGDDSSTGEPGPLPMNGIPYDTVNHVIRESAGSLVHLETDERCGKEWVGFRYFVRKIA